MFEVKIPKMGMSTVEVDLVAWHVKVGDRVQKGTPLADVETEKASDTIESPVDGVVAEIIVAAGGVTEAGQTICIIQTEG